MGRIPQKRRFGNEFDVLGVRTFLPIPFYRGILTKHACSVTLGTRHPTWIEKEEVHLTTTTRTFSLPRLPFRFWSYVRRYQAKFWIQAAGGILYNTVIVAGPIFIGKMIDAAIEIERRGSSPARLRALALYAALFVLATIFFQFARYVKRWWLRAAILNMAT